MAVYSINDIAALTGIKPHTLRIWEKRYGLAISRRTAANVRYYQDEDLRRIINISILNKKGLKISKIADLSWDEMRKRVAEEVDVHHSHETDLDSLSLSVINLDQSGFDKILRINEEQNGFSWVLENRIFPLFEKMNAMYLTGTIKPMHESFFNHMLKGKIMTQIDKKRGKRAGKQPEYILFQPQGSSEELGLMLLEYYLLEQDKATLNLGSQVSATDIVQAHELHPTPYIIGLFNAQLSRAEIEIYMNQIQRHCPGCEFVLSGFDIYQAGIDEAPGIKIMADLHAITDYFKYAGNGVLTH